MSRKYALRCLWALALVALGGCGAAGGADGNAAETAPEGAGAPDVLASDAGTTRARDDASSGELLRGFEDQLRFADTVADALKRDALLLDDARLDRQLSAVDERLGVLRARLDGLRRLDRAALEAAGPQWDAGIAEVRSMCSRARAMLDDLGE